MSRRAMLLGSHVVPLTALVNAIRENEYLVQEVPPLRSNGRSDQGQLPLPPAVAWSQGGLRWLHLTGRPRWDGREPLRSP